VPVLVGPEQVKDVVKSGDATASDICTADVAAACAQHGVS
jgi:D-xylose transport system substrate-binding protein